MVVGDWWMIVEIYCECIVVCLIVVFDWDYLVVFGVIVEVG